MIKWYKPSEKTPEVGDVIVTFERTFRGVFMRDWKIEEHDQKYAHHLTWAYASDFNFPKSEGEE